jgi:hypothetical protein
MNDTPGWASPGSTPPDGQEPGASRPADAGGQPTDRPGATPEGVGAKWAGDQPPPGQWSAPTGTPGPGQAPPPPPPPGQGWGGGPGGPGGYGGYGGYGPPGGYGTPWGGGWGGPPPAAKPGVIPLRPLGVGEILDGTMSTMRAYWRTVLGISLTVAVVTELVTVLFQGFVINDLASSKALEDPNPTSDEVFRAIGGTFAGGGLVGLISLVGTVIATALLTTVTSRAVLGKPVTTGEAWRDARPQALRLFGLIILLGLIAGVVFAVGVTPGIILAVATSGPAGVLLAVLGGVGAFVVMMWLMIRFSLASPALMLEKQSIRKSLSRSVKLVRGSWWRVLGIQLLATIIASIMSSIIALPFAFAAMALDGNGITGFLSSASNQVGWTFLIISGIGTVIGSTLTFPITAGVVVLLYIDQRIRREALDIELARAAGVQGYGPAPAPGS